MIDISILNDYIIELDFFSRSFLEQRVRNYGIDAVLAKQFECLVCRKTVKGDTVQQTNGYSYRNELSQTIELINNYIKKEDRDSYFEKLIELHKDNLKFEEDNPPIPAKMKRVKRSTTSEPKEKKETAAERKAKATAMKLSKLSINLKSKK